jgi:hypothetical protein
MTHFGRKHFEFAFDPHVGQNDARGIYLPYFRKKFSQIFFFRVMSQVAAQEVFFLSRDDMSSLRPVAKSFRHFCYITENFCHFRDVTAQFFCHFLR